MEIYARLTMRQCYFVLTSFDNSSDCNLPLRLFKVSSMVKVTLTIFFFQNGTRRSIGEIAVLKKIIKPQFGFT